MKKLLVLISVLFTLQGCVFVVGAAAGAATVAVVYDHRKIEKIMLDEQIAKSANDGLRSNQALHTNAHIEVNCFNQIVLLTGEALTLGLSQEAERQVRLLPDVKRVYNQIVIRGPVSKLTQASDGWITTKIKTRMLATKGLQSSTIKVVTENGSVYLMGSVDRKQAEIAINIARQVSGVQRVIKIFQYIK